MSTIAGDNEDPCHKYKDLVLLNWNKKKNIETDNCIYHMCSSIYVLVSLDLAISSDLWKIEHYLQICFCKINKPQY